MREEKREMREQEKKEQGKNEKNKVKDTYLNRNLIQQALFSHVHG